MIFLKFLDNQKRSKIPNVKIQSAIIKIILEDSINILKDIKNKTKFIIHFYAQ